MSVIKISSSTTQHMQNHLIDYLASPSTYAENNQT